jgi:signal recognition particle subunit SEC65
MIVRYIYLIYINIKFMESQETLVKKYIKIYPSYIDKALKHSEGRKVSSSIAMENPRIEEINAVCSQVLGLDSKKENVEPNFYSSTITLKIG